MLIHDRTSLSFSVNSRYYRIPTRTLKISADIIPRGELLDVLNGGANVLIWGLKFGVGEIIWGLKFQDPKCAICGLKSRVDKIIWGLIFLVRHCPSHFLSIKFVFETGQVIIWGL